ncbi:MAG: response regulator [Thainema sp.]
MKILLVEDDKSIVELLTVSLSQQNYVLDVALDGAIGWEMASLSPYDLILLDIGLPKLDGISFCRQLRDMGNQSPVLLLTARDAADDRVLGLDSGADDYVIKPFNIQELTARIRALLRRGNTTGSPLLTCGNLCLDPSKRQITYSDQIMPFSRKEYLLLELFLRNQKHVFSRNMIIDRLWSIGEDPPGEDTIKSHIKNIRRKLKAVGADDLVETMYGQGYRINPKYLESEIDQPEVDQSEIETIVDSTPSEKEAMLAQSALEIWERTKEMSFQRLDVLKQIVQSLQDNRLDHNTLSLAVQAAHKLAGSLGTFGFEDGSRLAREIEHQLQAADQLHCSEHSQNELLQDITEQDVTRSHAKPQLLAKHLQRNLYQHIEPLVTDLCAGVIRPDSFSLLSSVTSSSTTFNANAGNTKHAGSVSAQPVTDPVDSVSVASDWPLLLIVDSDRNLAETLSSEATKRSFRTAIAINLDTAEAAIQATPPDIILVDPDCITATGAETSIRKIRQQAPQVPVVLFSDQAETCDRVATIKASGCLFLQKSIAPSQAVQTISNFLQSSCRTKAKVLAVDDDTQILETLKLILEPQGFQVVGLDDPTQFWSTLNTVKPNFLILDINMEPVDGIELCQSVRHNLQWNWLPILFLTAQTDREMLDHAFAVGGDDYIAKPIAPAELSERLTKRWQRIHLLQNPAVVM